MMKLIVGSEVFPLNDVSNWSITSQIGGFKSIQFDISPQAEIYKEIAEEARIEYDNVYYNIKTVNERKTVATVTAEIDLDGLRGTIISEFVTQTKTLAETLGQALDGTDWSVVGAGLVSSRRSMDLSDVTPLDIVNHCTLKTMYNISFDVDNKNKLLNVSVKNEVSGNVFFSDELNLTELNFKGSSSNLVTRLYAYGKDGMSFADINDGKEYVDDNSYSDKVVATVWRDERYTVVENLLADAREKLAEMAVPERSYTCTVLDLAKLAPEQYSELSFGLNSVIILIDRRRKTRMKHTIVQTKEYPNEPARNTVILSTTPDTLSKKLTSTSISIGEVVSTVEKQPSVWEQAIQNATSLITGASGGYVVLNPSEKPSEILIMDTDNINTATSVWRWNSNGLGYSANGYAGPYTTAITMDGKIVADFITAGVLQGIQIICNSGSVGGWTVTANGILSPNGKAAIKVEDDIGNSDITDGIYFYRNNGTKAGSLAYHSRYDWAILDVDSVISNNAELINLKAKYYSLIQNDGSEVSLSLKTATLANGTTITYLGV